MSIISILKRALLGNRTESPPAVPPSLPPRLLATQTNLSCPYCGKDFSKRKTPSRRSTFNCPACAKSVYVEPTQPIYPTPYLDDIQATYVNFLWQLDHWVFGIGSNDDYRRKKTELAKQFGKEPGIGDVIWGLMNDSLVKACQDQIERREMKKLISDFRTFENEMKKGRKT